MRKAVLPAILCCVLALAAWTPARAQLSHTWVASNGDDANNCDVATPCATFGGALAKTFTGGEIGCINSGNYFGVTISRSITINCEAVSGTVFKVGGVNASSIAITGTAASDVVTLRGLDIDGAFQVAPNGTGLVSVSSPVTLRVEKVRISNFRGNVYGIIFQPSGPAKLHVSDSVIANNGDSGISAGIFIKPAAGAQTSVLIERTSVDNNLFGIFADGTAGGIVRGVVKDSVISGNANNGISVNTSGANVGLLVDNSTASGNNVGLAAGGAGGLILVRHSAITANNTGLSAGGGGSLVTYRDNVVNNNTTDGAFSFAIGLQ